MDFFMGFFSQMASTVGVIFLFGFIIALLRRAFCAVTGRVGPKILLGTGIIGTPIHELSHAAMCLLFGHRITDICLYQPDSDDGTLGYVSHSYNQRNIYHQIGNFFIGVAPVLLGGGVVVLLMYLLTPATFGFVKYEIMALGSSDLTSIPVGDYFEFLGNSIGEIFSSYNLSSWEGWVFIILALMISTHMEMSGADIKGSLKGLLFITIILGLVDGIIYLVSFDTFVEISEAAMSFGFMFSAFLSLSVLFLVALLAIALIIKGILMLLHR